MSQYPAMTNAPVPTAPTLAANVMHFARLLRRAGLPVGPAETLAAQQALSLIELGSKAETRTALRAVMTHRHEHQEVFEQAFALFWRDPTAAEQATAMALLEAQKEKKLELFFFFTGAGATPLTDAVISRMARAMGVSSLVSGMAEFCIWRTAA